MAVLGMLTLVDDPPDWTAVAVETDCAEVEPLAVGVEEDDVAGAIETDSDCARTDEIIKASSMTSSGNESIGAREREKREERKWSRKGKLTIEGRGGPCASVPRFERSSVLQK